MAELVRNRRPLTVPPTASLRECCAMMHRHRVGAVLVVEGEKLLGIFTGRDAIQCLAEARGAETRVSEAMTPSPTCVGPHHKAMDALRLLSDCGFRHLPVVEDGRVVGIVSRYDFRAREHAQLDEETGFFEMLR
jgi:CBS domain-containing protein